MPETYNVVLANRLGALALALGDRITDAVEQATETRGGVPAALVSLHEWADGSSIAVLAEAMRVTHSRAVRVVDQLEASDLAHRERSRDDARRATVRLTADGRALAERALQARAAALASLVDRLDADEARALGGPLRSLLAAATTNGRVASAVCRLCDAHACGHHDGSCPVTQATAASHR